MKYYLYSITVTLVIAVPDDTVIKSILQVGNNNFTGNMFSKVIQENQDRSMVLSGFSVLTPLSQLAIASEGTTHDELLKVIAIPNDDSIIAVFSYINRKMRSIPGIELQMASRIYISLNYDVNENFAAISKDIFESEVINVDFANNIRTAAQINNWVEMKTNHNIKNLIDPSTLSDSVRAILVNVLYFKGTWKSQFDKQQTKTKPFYINKHNHIQASTMYTNAKYKYGQSHTLQAQILEMPYVGDQSSMVIILPNELEGIGSLINKLKDLSVLNEEIISTHEEEIDVFIPKFKIETTIDLKRLLQNMNVTKMFNAEANFNKLLKTHEELFVSEAIQKSFIEVNEEGAEASAANMMKIMIKSSGTPPPVFNANHPFIFVLKSNNINLFSGVYNG